MPDSIAQLQERLRVLENNPPSDRLTGYPGNGGVVVDPTSRWMMQRQELARQIQQAQSSGKSTDPIEAAREEAYGLARGAVSQQNPIDKMVLEALQQRSGADGGPFDAATRNALMTQASDAAGQAALNQRGRIQGSASDPSVMAANNEADARRQQAIQQAQLGINTQANVANYDARGQALGQLGNYNMQVQGNQTDNERYLMGMLQREQQTTQMPDYAGGIPSFQQYSQQRQPQYQQQQYQQPVQQPQRTAAPTQATQPTRTVAPTSTVNWQNPTQATYTMTGPAGTVTGYNGGHTAPSGGVSTAPAPVPARIIRPGTDISYLNPYRPPGT